MPARSDPMQVTATLAWQSPGRGMLLESPIWCGQSNSLYWIDVIEPSVHRFRFDSSQSERWTLPKPPGSIALISPTRLLVAMRSALAILDVASGDLSSLAWDGPQLEEDRFNDGVTDRQGNFWVGTMDRRLERPIGRLFRFGPGLTASAVGIEARLSNGLCFTPDGRRMYLSKTFEREIHAFDVDPASGALSAGRRIVAFDDTPGRPDGSTVASDGSLWSARVGGHRIDRYDADGRPLGRLDLPTSHPTHCTFGGPDLTTLFVTTSRYGEEFQAADRGGDVYAGSVLGYRVEWAGLPQARFIPARDRNAGKPA